MEEVKLRNTRDFECHCTVSALLSVYCCKLKVLVLYYIKFANFTSFDFASDSNTGFIIRHGPQFGLQKSTAIAGDSLINFYSCYRFAI